MKADILIEVDGNIVRVEEKAIDLYLRFESPKSMIVDEGDIARCLAIFFEQRRKWILERLDKSLDDQ